MRVKEATGVLIGVQTPPHHDLALIAGCGGWGQPCPSASSCSTGSASRRSAREAPAVRARPLSRGDRVLRHPGGRPGGVRALWNGEIIAGPRAAGGLDRSHRLDHARGRGAHGVRVPPLAGTDYRDVPRPPSRTWCRSSGSTKPAWSGASPSESRPTCTFPWSCCRRRRAGCRTTVAASAPAACGSRPCGRCSPRQFRQELRPMGVKPGVGSVAL